MQCEYAAKIEIGLLVRIKRVVNVKQNFDSNFKFQGS